MRGRNSEVTPYFSGPGYVLSRDLIVDAGSLDNVSTFHMDPYGLLSMFVLFSG